MFEDRPEKDTPQHIIDELREYGGESPDGKPIWQLVLAQNCRNRCFGTMNHIDPGLVASMSDETRPTDIIPDRIEEGQFWIPRYSVKGWILRRWYPASVWGARSTWEGQKAKDGRTRLLAAYPQGGDYMMMPCGPWKTIQQAGDLKAAIRSYNMQKRMDPVNWANYEQAWVAMDAQKRQQDAEACAEELEMQYRSAMSGILRTVSGAAQKVRNAMAGYSVGGINLGASNKWG